MAKTAYQTIDEYHNAYSGEVLERMQQIRATICRIAPEAEEVISYQIPAFKIGKQFLIYYAAFAKHLTLSHPWTAAFLQHFESELQGMKVSKSAIQFPLDQPLDMQLVERMITFRKQEVTA